MPRTSDGHHEPSSPLAVLTELAVEGTSSLIEAQRISLDLAKRENEILMNGIQERLGQFTPAATVTDLFRHGIDTFLGMQQDLLTTTSKQTMHWIEAIQSGKPYEGARVLEMAREGIDDFVRAQHKFLDVLGKETVRMTREKPAHATPVKQTELPELAREATMAFIEAQKKMLDVVGQQMNVNLELATKMADSLSPTRLSSMTKLPEEAVKAIMGAERKIMSTVVEPGKKMLRMEKRERKPAARRRKMA